MDLVRFTKILLRRKSLLLTVPMLGMILAFYLTRNTPDTYKSETTLAAGIIDDTKISIEENTAEKTSTFVIATKFSNIIELIKSKSVIDLVSYELLIHDLNSKYPFRKFNKESYSIIRSEGSKISDSLNAKLTTLNFRYLDPAINTYVNKLVKSQEYGYEDILKKLKVERVKESDFIKMEYESENPYLSAFVLNKLSEIFIGSYRNLMSEKTSSSVDFFKKLADEKKQELDELVDKLKQFKLDHKIINLYEQTKSLVNQISSLEIIRENENKQIPSLKEAIKDIDKRFTPADKKYYEAETSKYAGVISVIKEKINSLNERLIEGGAVNPAISDSIASLRRTLANQVTGMSDSLVLDPNAVRQDLVQKKVSYELDLDIAYQSVKSNDKELNRLHSIAESFAPSEVSVSAFEREISVTAQSYLVLLNKLNLAKFAVEDIGNNVHQTEIAIAPEKPEANKKLIMILLVGIIGFVLTIVVVFALEYIDLTIQSPARLKQFSGLSTIGDINHLNTASVNIKEIFSGNPDDQSIVYFKNALRDLRYNISTLTNGNKVVLFTSTNEYTGKSFVITSLAYSLSLIGKKVLLVDSDFKNNTLTRQFGAPETSPLLFNGDKDLLSAINQSSVPGIDIIGTGTTSRTPVELINQAGFTKALNDLKNIYDYIFIEAPGLNRNIAAKELLPYCGYVLLVFSAKSIIEPADKKSIEFIKNTGQPFGTVLNNIEYEQLEEIQGEVIKKRSVARMFIKNIVKRNLKSKSEQNAEVKIG